MSWRNDGSTATKNGIGARERKGAEGPIESQFFQIILGDFDKLGLDFDLGGLLAHRGVNQRFDQVQIRSRIADDKATAAWIKVGAGAGWKLHTLCLEEVPCALAYGEPGSPSCDAGVATRLRRGLDFRRGASGDEAWWHFEFPLLEGIRRLRERYNRDGEGLHLHLQTGQRGHVAQGFVKGNIAEVERDAAIRAIACGGRGFALHLQGVGCGGGSGGQFQDNIDSAALGVVLGRVQIAAALLEETDRLAHGRIAEVDTGNDNSVESGHHEFGAPPLLGQSGGVGGARVNEAALGALPSLVHLPKHARPGFVVGGVVVALLAQFDLFHAAESC